MKKIIALVLAAGMTLALLSGCGGSNNSGNSGNARQGSGTQAQEAAAESAEQVQEAAAESAEQVQEPAAGPAEQVQVLVAEPAEAAAVPRMAGAENTYIVLVRDASGDTPVQGVQEQFCSDTQCMAQKTDENGAAVFEAEPGTYTAHVLRVPEGYEKNGETFEMTPENRTVQFALQKKGEAAGS